MKTTPVAGVKRIYLMGPIRQHARRFRLHDIRFSRVERTLIALSILFLIVSGYVEAYLIHGLG